VKVLLTSFSFLFAFGANICCDQRISIAKFYHPIPLIVIIRVGSPTRSRATVLILNPLTLNNGQ